MRFSVEGLEVQFASECPRKLSETEDDHVFAPEMVSPMLFGNGLPSSPVSQTERRTFRTRSRQKKSHPVRSETATIRLNQIRRPSRGRTRQFRSESSIGEGQANEVPGWAPSCPGGLERRHARRPSGDSTSSLAFLSEPSGESAVPGDSNLERPTGEDASRTPHLPRTVSG